MTRVAVKKYRQCERALQRNYGSWPLSKKEKYLERCNLLLQNLSIRQLEIDDNKFRFVDPPSPDRAPAHNQNRNPAPPAPEQEAPAPPEQGAPQIPPEQVEADDIEENIQDFDIENFRGEEDILDVEDHDEDIDDIVQPQVVALGRRRSERLRGRAPAQVAADDIEQNIEDFGNADVRDEEDHNPAPEQVEDDDNEQNIQDFGDAAVRNEEDRNPPPEQEAPAPSEQVEVLNPPPEQGAPEVPPDQVEASAPRRSERLKGKAPAPAHGDRSQAPRCKGKKSTKKAAPALTTPRREQTSTAAPDDTLDNPVQTMNDIRTQLLMNSLSRVPYWSCLLEALCDELPSVAYPLGVDKWHGKALGRMEDHFRLSLSDETKLQLKGIIGSTEKSKVIDFLADESITMTWGAGNSLYLVVPDNTDNWDLPEYGKLKRDLEKAGKI